MHLELEVEQKFRVIDPTAARESLLALGVDPLASTPMEQIDLYYAHPARDFAQTDEALRIRSVGDANCITYKGPKLDATTKTRRELEIPLADGRPTAAVWGEMLVALGFRPVLEVRKLRRSQTLSFRGRDVEIAWDEVAGLGTFIELEFSADEQSLDEAKNCLAELATKLGLSDSERRSYLEMLLEAQR